MKRTGNIPAGTNVPAGTSASANAREDVHIQEFLDMIAPSVIRFETDHFICGNTYRCVWALRECLQVPEAGELTVNNFYLCG